MCIIPIRCGCALVTGKMVSKSAYASLNDTSNRSQQLSHHNIAIPVQFQAALPPFLFPPSSSLKSTEAGNCDSQHGIYITRNSCRPSRILPTDPTTPLIITVHRPTATTARRLLLLLLISPNIKPIATYIYCTVH